MCDVSVGVVCALPLHRPLRVERYLEVVREVGGKVGEKPQRVADDNDSVAVRCRKEPLQQKKKRKEPC